MPADIPLRQRAVDRVGQRVHPHIGIGMPLQPAPVGHRHAAKHHVVALAEAVHVEAGADPYVHVSQNPFCPGEIARVGDLEVALVPLDDLYRDPGGARHLDIVGGIAGMRPVGGEDGGEGKALRGLRAVEAGAVLRACHVAPGALPKRVGHGQRRGGGQRAVFQCGKHAGDQGGADTTARGVVDQDGVDSGTFKRFQPVANRSRPCFAARNDAQPRARRDPVQFIRVQHHDDVAHLRHRLEGRQRPFDHALLPKGLPLFRQVPPGTGAAPGGDDDGSGCHVP